MVSKAETRFTAFVTYVLQKWQLMQSIRLKEQNFLQQN